MSTAAAALVSAATLPFFVIHLRNLWIHRPHYQFFPAVLLGVGLLMYLRWPRPVAVHQTPASRRLGAALLFSGLMIAVLSLWWYSPWLGAIAWVLALGGVILQRTGSDGLRALAGPWLLLWLVIPPPWPLDDEAIRGLQEVTAVATGNMLEFAGVDHLLTGKVFRLPDRELFVAEACSGIHSQLVLIAASAVFAVAVRRPWLHTLLLMAAAVFWSVAMNVVRVGVVVAAAAHFGVDLSTGLVHDVLGHVLLACGFLLLLSTDQFLMGLLPLGLYFTRAVHPDEGEPVPDPPPPVADVAPSATTTATRAGTSRAVLILFAAVGLLQLGSILRQPAQVSVDVAEFDEAFPQDCLPRDVGEWRQTEFESIERDRTSDAGHYSRIWHFDSGHHESLFSIDFPFLGWHDLARCYVARGWDVHQQRILEGAGWEIVEVEMTRPTGEYGLLLYSLLDASGSPHSIPGELEGHVQKRLEQPGGTRLAAESNTTIQCQQFIVNEYRLLDEERLDVVRLFDGLREDVRSEWKRHRGGQ